MNPDAADGKLVTIPFFDIRETGLTSVVEGNKEMTASLLKASCGAYGWPSQAASHVALPLGDWLSRRWLQKTQNPYRAEIEKTAQLVPCKGVIALNLCYEWGCTSGAYQTAPGAPLLARVLDWPFPALGEHTIVTLQKGPAGEFHNVTWPGMSGVLNGVAKGRFAVALNQAPMRRHWSGIFISWARNRFLVNGQKGLPPTHLLRHVFETAKDYAEAKKMLAETPVALPVLYTLTGTKEGEGCVIERTETKAAIRGMQDGRVTTANHFESHLNGLGHGWMPRAHCSHTRACASAEIPLQDFADGFAWFRDPVANSLSRLAMTANAATGAFSAMGTAGVAPVTQVFSA